MKAFPFTEEMPIGLKDKLEMDDRFADFRIGNVALDISRIAALIVIFAIAISDYPKFARIIIAFSIFIHISMTYSVSASRLDRRMTGADQRMDWLSLQLAMIGMVRTAVAGTPLDEGQATMIRHDAIDQARRELDQDPQLYAMRKPGAPAGWTIVMTSLAFNILFYGLLIGVGTLASRLLA